MPRRSRSRSPRRDRDRGRDRSRDRDRRDRERGVRRDYDSRGDRDRERDERLRDDRPRGERFPRRSRSPVERFRTAPGSSSSSSSSAPKPAKEEKKRFTAEDFAGKSEEEIEMMKCMGFGGFNTTKGKKVDGNDVGAVHVKLKRTYRQYMNRRGGFNRPLDAVH